jgi:hypothetical protein
MLKIRQSLQVVVRHGSLRRGAPGRLLTTSAAAQPTPASSSNVWVSVAAGAVAALGGAVFGWGCSDYATSAGASDATVTNLSFDELQRRLLAINTAAVADADKEGLRVMDERLRPLPKRDGREIKWAGRARTVRAPLLLLLLLLILPLSLC